MLARHYAEALIDTEADNAAEALVGVLERKGHLALLPQIVSEYEKRAAEKEHLERTQVRVKNTEQITHLKDRIAHYEEKLSFAIDDAHVVEDPSIVGGFVVEQGTREVDESYRKHLIKLYQKLTAVNI